MGQKFYNEADVQAIAAAIRAKNGTQNTYTVSQMPAAIAAITTGVPAETLVYAQRNAAAGAFVDEVTYDPADYTVSRIAAYVGASGNDKPLGGTFSAPENGRVVLLDSGRCAVLTVSAGNNTLYNITPNTTGAFVFLTQDDRIGAVGPLRPGGALRMLKLNDASNVRDLGGWACDGGTVRYGKLFRGSRLFISGSVNAYDKTVLHDLLGIQHELDLRYANELERDFSLIGSDVDWTHIDGAWYAIRDSAKCRAILECVFDCVLNGIPLYFHCAGGADRTGTLSMWLEALLGVSQSDIDKDYELTSFFSGVATDAQARRRNESEWQGLITAFRDYPGGTIRDRVFAWTVTLGIPVATINAFRAAMINGTPQALVNPYGTVAVNKIFAHITIDNAAQSTEMYQPYTATLSADSGYSLAGASVAVTMGGVDVTADCYQNGVIHIEQVTGALIITATAVTQITNQILYGTDTIGGTALYNGTGYKQGYRWTSSNTEDNGEISGIPNKFAVGYIKVEPGDVVHLYGDIWKGTSGGISMHVQNATDTRLVRASLANWSGGYTARSDIMAYMSDIDYDDTTKTLRSFRWTGGTSAVTGYMHWTFVGVFDAYQTVLTINEEM